MNILKGNVNINAPAEVVQIALKGLLSYKGVDNPQSYSLDRKAIKALQKTFRFIDQHKNFKIRYRFDVRRNFKPII